MRYIAIGVPIGNIEIIGKSETYAFRNLCEHPITDLPFCGHCGIRAQGIGWDGKRFWLPDRSIQTQPQTIVIEHSGDIILGELITKEVTGVDDLDNSGNHLKRIVGDAIYEHFDKTFRTWAGLYIFDNGTINGEPIGKYSAEEKGA